MQNNRNIKLLAKILGISVIVAGLAYLFHPDVGQLSLMYNGQPIADPLIRFAAIPTFLAIMGLAAILTVMLFLGIGVFMFVGAIAVALIVCLAIAPYFWPVLLIVVLISALMSFDHDDKNG